MPPTTASSVRDFLREITFAVQARSTRYLKVKGNSPSDPQYKDMAAIDEVLTAAAKTIHEANRKHWR